MALALSVVMSYFAHFTSQQTAFSMVGKYVDQILLKIVSILYSIS